MIPQLESRSITTYYLMPGGDTAVAKKKGVHIAGLFLRKSRHNLSSRSKFAQICSTKFGLPSGCSRLAKSNWQQSLQTEANVTILLHPFRLPPMVDKILLDRFLGRHDGSLSVFLLWNLAMLAGTEHYFFLNFEDRHAGRF
jgi:hypothetical protein